MRLSIIIILFPFLFILSCDKSEKLYTEEEARKYSDSVFQEKSKIILEDARKNLEIRRKIELRELVQERKNQKNKQPDSIDSL